VAVAELELEVRGLDVLHLSSIGAISGAAHDVLHLSSVGAISSSAPLEPFAEAPR
jgi:hypothetical protein